MKRVSVCALSALAMVLLYGCGSSEDDIVPQTNAPSTPAATQNNDSEETNKPVDANAPIVDSNMPSEPKKEISGELIPQPGQAGWTEGAIPIKPNISSESPSAGGTSTSVGSTKTTIPTPPTINQPTSPLQVFQGMDRGLKSLQNSKVTFNLQVKFPEGDGKYQNDSVIKDKKRFRLSYACLVQEPVPHLEEYITTQRQGKTITFGDGKVSPGRVIVDKVPDIEELPQNITHYLSSAIASDAKPMEGIFRAAQKKGWTMKVEKKVFDIGVFQRIYMESPKGQPIVHRYQFTVNPNEKMPTDVKMEVVDPKGKKNTKLELLVTYAKKDTPVTEDDLKISTRVEAFKGMATDEDIDKMIEKRKKEEEKKAPEKPKS